MVRQVSEIEFVITPLKKPDQAVIHYLQAIIAMQLKDQGLADRVVDLVAHALARQQARVEHQA